MFTSILSAVHLHKLLHTNHLSFKAFTTEVLLCHTLVRCK